MASEIDSATLISLIASFAIILFFLVLALYIYTSCAFMAIARRVKCAYSPGIAWIPLVGPALISSSIAKMPWWPMLFFLGIFIPVFGFLFLIVFVVYSTIWMWKTFEALNRPGWWAIFAIIPLLNVVYYVLLGIAAWGNNK
ncbi:MAG: hypothetical protein AABW82_03780 [Nanoarchaeota archaeon]